MPVEPGLGNLCVVECLAAAPVAAVNTVISLMNLTSADAALSGVPADAMYAQKTYNPMFSAEGTFAGQSVQDVADALINGDLTAADVPVNYIIRDGQPIILNTRSAQALDSAGIPMNSWNGINVTGNSFFESLLDGQLSRNPGAPFTTVRPSSP
jgi:hypothetical protein